MTNTAAVEKVPISFRIDTKLLEQLKSEARERGTKENRDVVYTEIVHELLEDHFTVNPKKDFSQISMDLLCHFLDEGHQISREVNDRFRKAHRKCFVIKDSMGMEVLCKFTVTEFDMWDISLNKLDTRGKLEFEYTVLPGRPT